jgi:hypothetical protein
MRALRFGPFYCAPGGVGIIFPLVRRIVVIRLNAGIRNVTFNAGVTVSLLYKAADRVIASAAEGDK